ncbi:PatA/PatG family cyanobactin maturation protease [Mesorhizobium cantuariense]|uniref:PatA/PatG family cyanobactin maturation protease n=1 Tax=Mesorhizobium cantuariense TaxID=1300275 RepID=A0ABV7MTZ2_9HYPH
MHAALKQRPGCAEICIAVLDGPVDLAHPCFAGALLQAPFGQSPAPRAGCPATDHGTHVASIIFGQPGGPVPGIAPGCRGIALPVFGSRANAALTCSQLDLARALTLAVERGAHVINISGGQLDFSLDPEPLLREALNRCEEAGILVVAAAGNDSCDCPHTPASYPTVLAVGAADENGDPLRSSNWSAAYAATGLLAPGKNVLGAAVGGGTIRLSGTSFATPIVSGHAALLLCEQIAAGGVAAPLAVRAALLESASNCSPETALTCLAGRLNPAGAKTLLKRRRLVMESIGDTTHTLVTEDLTRPVRASGESQPDFGAELQPAPPALSVSGRAGSVTASCGDGGCGCGGKAGGCGRGGAKPEKQLVYALGNIGFDFGSESRRDSIFQFMLDEDKNEKFTVAKLIAYLKKTPEEIERLIWTLTIDGTPAYALQPAGAFAYQTYANLIAAFEAQEKGDLSLVAVPGVSVGSLRLMSGETVPLLFPSSRGIVEWDIKKVARKAIGLQSDKAEPEDAGVLRQVTTFFEDYTAMTTRRYRNLGVAGRDRALNYAALDADELIKFVKDQHGIQLVLDEIKVSRSVACRTGAECFDVAMHFFVPSDTTASIRVIQYTVDVGDIIPVRIGKASTWSERPRN